MPHPIVHAEIRSADPDATRKFFGDLLGWTYPDHGAIPGYTFVDTGLPGALYTAISAKATPGTCWGSWTTRKATSWA